MPLLRIEIEATDRTEAQRVLSLYATGERLPSLDAEVLDEAWSLGRTPMGRPRLIGLTNGSPTLYKFDVEVDSGIDR